MTSEISNSITSIVLQLQKRGNTNINAFLGFDACIDNILKVVRDKKINSEHDFFSSSHQFGEFLICRENKSCGIELQTQLSKLGGNMVITANALGNLGIKIDCVGTFGLPEILPVFRSISSNCKLYTIGDTITANALEFNDSKVIMFDPGPYDKLNWDGIKNLLGIRKIKHLITGKQLVSFLNWSEIENSSQIWKGFLDDILPSLKVSEAKPFFFTDISDCSRRSADEIRTAVGLLVRFKKYFRVAISLNQNEADLIAKAFDINHVSEDEEFIKKLFSAIDVDELVVHRVRDAIVYDGISYSKCDTFYCSEPAILTGGGDNFNAGYCFARLNNLDLFQSIVVANAVSGSYVKTGISPDVEHLKEFLELELKQVETD
jgi:hypothetical protein